MHSLVLFGVTFFGIILNNVDVSSPTKKCIHIVNYTFGIIECKQNEHIHLEKIWLDNENCYHRPPSASSIIANISVLECENISKCRVPFKSGNSKYKNINILYQCTACLSVTHGAELHIVCERNTLIRIQDVWENYMSACPAFKNTHSNRYTTHNVYSKCNGKQTCNITTHIGFGIFSVYFYCEGHSTTNINNMYTTKSTHYVNTKPVLSSISSTPSLLSTVNTTVLLLTTSKEISGGFIAGGVVAGLLVLLLPLGIIFYRRRCSDSTKSPQKQFVTRSNRTDESEMDVGTIGNPNKNDKSSLYHEYFEVQNDQAIVTPTHNYMNTDTITYDYASENISMKDDTYDNMQRGVGGKQQPDEVDSNNYSHLKDTFIDSNENPYNHTIHDRVQETSENEYSVSRGQMSEDDYDVSGNHYRGNHKNGSDSVYN